VAFTGAFAVQRPPRVSGEWFKGDGVHVATVSSFNGRVHYFPVLIDQTISIDRLAIEVTTAVASSNARLGIYLDNGNRVPGTLHFDAGADIDCSTTGVKDLTVSTTLPKGLIHLAIGVAGGASAPTFVGLAPLTGIIGSTSAGIALGDAPGLLSASSSYAGGALPSTALTSNARTNRIPKIVFRTV
jgi:hypothetical protein